MWTTLESNMVLKEEENRKRTIEKFYVGVRFVDILIISVLPTSVHSLLTLFSKGFFHLKRMYHNTFKDTVADNSKLELSKS